MIKKISLLTAVCFLSACAHSVHLYQADHLEGQKGQLIESLSEQKVILGFTKDTLYADQAFDQLKAKCPNGRVEGINTRYSTSLGFFSWTNKIRMRGYCVKS